MRWLVLYFVEREEVEVEQKDEYGREGNELTGVIVLVTIRLSLFIRGGLILRLVALITSLINAAAAYVGLSRHSV